MARREVATSVAEQLKPIVEPVGQLIHGQHPEPDRRQLDRQRDSLESSAQAYDGSLVLAGDREAWHGGDGPIGEQCDSRELAGGAGRPALIDVSRTRARIARIPPIVGGQPAVLSP